MFDQTVRISWLNDSMWPAVRDKFGFSNIPPQGMFVPGFPSSGARGRSSKLKPAEINYQWTGNAAEPFMMSIHPVYWDKPRNVVAAVAFACAAASKGPRWGPHGIGLKKLENGVIEATPEAEAKITAILADIGEPPSGFGMPFPVREVSRARLRRYVCDQPFCTNGSGEKHPIIRAASDTLKVKCEHCGESYNAG